MDEDKQIKLLELSLKEEEIEAIKLVDIKKLKIKSCAKKMKISTQKFKEILESGREKIAKTLENGNTVKILIEEDEPIDNTLYLIFRCATCGTIYKVTGYEEKIACPLCFSSKVMSLEESGLLKVQPIGNLTRSI